MTRMWPMLVTIGSLICGGLWACQEPIALDWRVKLGSASVSTPRLGDNFIAVGSEQGLTIVRWDGGILCRQNGLGRVVGRPEVLGQRVFAATTRHRVVALDADRGCEIAWEFVAKDRLKSDPLRMGTTLVVSSYDGHVYALHTQDGHLIWKYPSETQGKTQTKAQAGSQVDSQSSQSEQLKIKPGAFSYASPVLLGDAIILGNLDGHLYALQAQSGALLWRHNIGAAITSTPWVEGDRFFVGSQDHRFYGFQKNPGKNKFRKIWQHETHDWVNGSARRVGEAVVVGGEDRTLWGLNPSTGGVLWRLTLQGPTVSRPWILAEDWLIAVGGSGDGQVYGIDTTGIPKIGWRFATQGKIESDPVGRGQQFFVSSTDGFLYAFSLHRGPKSGSKSAAGAR